MNEFERATREAQPSSLPAEFWYFLRHSKKWWLLPILAVIFLFGMLVFLWFVVGFTLLLRRAEGDPPWRSLVAWVSGGLVAAGRRVRRVRRCRRRSAPESCRPRR